MWERRLPRLDDVWACCGRIADFSRPKVKEKEAIQSTHRGTGVWESVVVHLEGPISVRTYVSKVMLKILQARLKQYMNHELPDVQAGFRKGRGTRDQIANIHWIIEKAREFQENIYFCLIDYAKTFDCVDHNKLENSERDGHTRLLDLPLEKPICRSGSNS